MLKQRNLKLFLATNRYFSIESRTTSNVFKAENKAPITTSILTDTFGRHHNYLRISLTEKCNLRCQYCMPAEGVKLSDNKNLLTTDEIVKLASLFVKNGVDKIRLTGGEPTVRRDVVDIVAQLKQLTGVNAVAMTTNGLTLTRQLPSLQQAGLDALNISLDTLKADRYEKITRRPGLNRTLAGIDLAVHLGYEPVKVNCVLVRHFNLDEVVDFIRLTENKPLDIRFIEYMPFFGNGWNRDGLVPYLEALEMIKKEFPRLERLQNVREDTAVSWKVKEWRGKFGFIASMTQPFCGGCNRLRLTADGGIKACLFGSKEISLRDALRAGCSDDDLEALIGAAVRLKKRQHAAPFGRSPSRLYSTFTHSDSSGHARMVDVSEKPSTKRTATAEALVRVGPESYRLILEHRTPKGDVLEVSRLAGIMAAKRTADLIPLCHPLRLDHVDVQADPQVGDFVRIVATATTTGRTGVEMEVMTAASVAALTVYDMCKGIDKSCEIVRVRLVRKSGGTSGDYEAPVENAGDGIRDYDRERITVLQPHVGPV